MPRLPCWLLLLIACPAHAAWLQLCPGAAGPVAGLSQQRPAGQCMAIDLGIPADQIEAIRVLAPGDKPEGTILLEGAIKDGSFVVESHTLPPAHPPPEPPAPMPLHDNLLADARLHTFGAEERVQARLANGRLELSCRAGTKPAGVILTGPWYLPHASVAARLDYTGHGSFSIDIADAAHARSEVALPMGAVTATNGSASSRLPVPAGLDRANFQQFVLNCPRQQAQLTVSSIRLEPLAAKAAPRSSWVWRAADWQQHAAALLAWARDQGVGVLFIAIPFDTDGVADPAVLAQFVRQAHGDGVKVLSVDGDPHMVLPGEQRAAFRRVQGYVAYNASVEPAAQLDGMQFDIEPYLLPGYAQDAAQFDRRYVELAQALRAAAGTQHLEFVVPWWWAGKRSLLDGLASAASALTVMDYRTDPGQLYRFAVPFLDWGEKAGKPVRIALEAGPVPPQTQRRYERAAGPGDLLLFWFGDTQVAVALRQPRAHPGAQAYRLAASRLLDGSATSFNVDKDRLRRLLPMLERDFGAWRQFGGLALHELREAP